MEKIFLLRLLAKKEILVKKSYHEDFKQILP